MAPRKDDPYGMELYKGAHYGEKALIVLGGSSGAGWKDLRDEIEPDVILGANGTCFEIQNLDYHLVVENMHLAAKYAGRGSQRYQKMMEILDTRYKAKVRLISYLSWDLIQDRQNVVKIKRMGELGDDYEEQLQRFSFREYGDGFLAGPIFAQRGALKSERIKFRVGTVGTQLLHVAGILGVKEVHTIGMDFCFRDQKRHHWYSYPTYQPDQFRSAAMFTRYKGIDTQWDWVEGALWLNSIEPLFDKAGLKWIDHSHGLLEAMGLRCTQ